MKEILNHIKEHNLKHVYLLYGDEQAVVKIYRNKILKELMGSDSLETLKQDLNFSIFTGTPIDVDSVIELATSYPFMGDKRVLVLENTKVFSKESTRLAECIKNLPETTYIIFTELTVSDKKGLFAAVKEVGYITEIDEQPRENVEGWVIRTLSESGKRISRTALDTLLQRAGLDMMRLTNELRKIIAYKGEDTDIKVEDIIALVNIEPQDKVFLMIDAMASRNADQAMKYYFDLLELKVPPQKILSLIERHMRILIQVKDLKNKGYATSAIPSRVKEVKAWAASKYASQASKLSTSDILECMNDCVELTLQSRTGAISDRLSVEYIIVKYSKQKSEKTERNTR